MDALTIVDLKRMQKAGLLTLDEFLKAAAPLIKQAGAGAVPDDDVQVVAQARRSRERGRAIQRAWSQVERSKDVVALRCLGSQSCCNQLQSVTINVSGNMCARVMYTEQLSIEMFVNMLSIVTIVVYNIQHQ